MDIEPLNGTEGVFIPTDKNPATSPGHEKIPVIYEVGGVYFVAEEGCAWMFSEPEFCTRADECRRDWLDSIRLNHSLGYFIDDLKLRVLKELNVEL